MARKPQFLVCFAQREELYGTFPFLEQQTLENINGEIWNTVENPNFIAWPVITGIGKVAMARNLTKALAELKFWHLGKPDYIINIGVAASISPSLKAFDVFIAEKEAYHDVDCTACGYKYGQMCSMPLYYDCSKKIIDFAKENSIKTGLILTGDSFVTKDIICKEKIENFDNPLCVDMESAAVGQVSYMEGIPHGIIRAISDEATGDENLEEYEKHLNEASKKAGEIALKFFRSVAMNW